MDMLSLKQLLEEKKKMLPGLLLALLLASNLAQFFWHRQRG